MGTESKPESLSSEQLEKLLLEIQQETEKKEYIADTYVKISEDKMEAWLYLTEAQDGSTYSKSDLISILKSNGVMEGYHQSNLAAMAKKGVYRREILVAIGISPKEGLPGRYDLKFTPPNLKASPKIREDGSVDYQSMSSLPNINKDDIVAIYIPAVPGQDGYDITGAIIRANGVRDLPPLRGKGITNQEDTNIYRAKVAGKIEMRDNMIDIQPIHEIHGNVDMIIGRVEFFGDVIISGNVEAGVIIRAGRNVIIGGTVSGATIYAGGDIVFKRGISGGKRAKITTKGNLMADFIENSEIDAAGSVQANTILNSKIMSKETVKVSGKKGVIYGGYTHGLTGIVATNIGNEAEVRTVVHAGYEPATYERFVFLTKRENELKKELSEFVEEMASILKNKRLRGNLNPIDEKNLIQYNKKKDDIFSELDNVKQERDRVGIEITKGRGVKIHVEGNIYQGVVICVENAQMIIEHSTVYMEYASTGGQVQGSVIVYK